MRLRSLISAFAPAPPPRDLNTVWKEHSAHRERSHQLRANFRSQALYCACLLNQVCEDAPNISLDALCQSLPLPLRSARGLLKRVQRRPPTDDAILRGRDFFARLEPIHAALIHCVTSARANSQNADLPDFTPGYAAAQGLSCYTFGFPREQIRAVWSRPPDAITPEQVALLDPITIPSSLPLPPPLPRLENLTVATLQASWADYQAAARDLAQHAGQRSGRLLELGRLLADLQDQLAVAGRASTFRTQLRQLGIPRTTAYRCIAAYRKSLISQGINGAEMRKPPAPAAPAPVPVFALHPGYFYAYLTPQQAVVVHFALKAFVPSPKRMGISEMIAAGFADAAPADLQPYLKQFFEAPPGSPQLQPLLRRWLPRAPVRVYPPAAA